LGAVLVVVVVVVIGAAILAMSGKDLTLQGRLYDESGNPITGATVDLEGFDVLQTNEFGGYRFTGVQAGKYQIEITARGYETIFQELNVQGSLFDSTVAQNFTLDPAGFGSISGQFVADDPTYNYIGDRLFIGKEEFNISPEGSFSLTNLTAGKNTLIYQSAEYLDIERVFTLLEGSNPDLEDIELSPAAEISGNLTSHVRKDLILDLDIRVEGVSDDQIEVMENGDFRIRNLEVGETYTIRISKEGYDTRDYEVEVERGVNQILGFSVVESGVIPFLSKVEDNALQLFLTNLDGTTITQLTFDEKMEPFAEYIEDSIIYFLSTRDRVRPTIGGNGFLVYAASTDGGNAQKITDYIDDFGRIVPNFSAKRMANVTLGYDEDEKDRRLGVMDLVGENRVDIDYVEDGTFNDIVLSDNGAYIYYFMQDKQDTVNGIYRANTQTGNSSLLVTRPNPLIYDVSHDGNRMLYSSYNSGTGLTELYLLTVSTGQDKRVLQTAAGMSQFQFIGTSDNEIVYQAFKNGANNVYHMDIDENTETQWTFFSGVEGVEAVYQQADYVLYQTNVGLYMIDPSQPVDKVLVTKRVARYTGYDF